MRMGNGAVPIPPLTVVAITIGLSLGYTIARRMTGRFVLEEASWPRWTSASGRTCLLAGPKHRAFRVDKGVTRSRTATRPGPP